MIPLPLRGRGTTHNPGNRFTPIHTETPEWTDPDDPSPTTRFFRDDTKEIFSTNDSPDIPFRYSLNPYRGCEHGCVYCYARPTHEYLSFSCGLDFETKIMVKENAPELVRKELSKPKWTPQFVAVSGVTDCYQPIERRLQITRKCLEVFADFRNPVCIVTKNALVARDADILGRMAEHDGAIVFLSVTTLDRTLASKMEPRASTPDARLRAMEKLTQAGVPVGVMVAPVIPGLTDHEAPMILKAAADAGAKFASYVVLRLPYQVKELFVTWLAQHYPERKSKVLQRILELRGGKLNQTEFGKRMKGEGVWADLFKQQFQLHRQRVGMDAYAATLDPSHFRVPGREGLFEGLE